MTWPPLSTFLGVWAFTTVSRMTPGALTLAALRTADERGVRAATAFLLGAFLAELAVTAALIGGVASLPSAFLQHRATRLASFSLALATAGGVLLWPTSEEHRRGGVTPGKAPAAVGFGVAVGTPGLWTWWASVGVVLVALGEPSLGALPLGAAVAAGLATSHVALLAVLRSMLMKTPRLAASVRRRIGAALLVAAGGVALLGILAHEDHVDPAVGGAARGGLVGGHRSAGVGVSDDEGVEAAGAQPGRHRAQHLAVWLRNGRGAAARG